VWRFDKDGIDDWIRMDQNESTDGREPRYVTTPEIHQAMCDGAYWENDTELTEGGIYPK
jgi:hypothetical protein